jgi:hypothetical protein
MRNPDLLREVHVERRIRRFFEGRADDGPRGPWLRGIASILALAAGVIHLAQIGPHSEEGWTFAAFFFVVGTVQVVAATLLLRPRPAAWFRFGLLGTAVVIGVWALSRTVGLPFGAEPGEREALGAADAAATLAEAMTVVVLAMWLGDRSAPRRQGGDVVAVALIVGLGAVWVVGRVSGVFDPDPRATIGLPQLADRAALLVVVSVAVMLGLLAVFPTSRPGWWAPLMRGLLTAVFVASGALVGLTLPAPSGQNVACTYAPITEVSRVSHDEVVPPAPLIPGAERWLAALELSVCGPDAVRLESVDVLNSRGRGEVLGYSLLPVGQRLPAEGVAELPAGSRALNSQPMLAPGEAWQLAVLIRGSDQAFNLDSLRIEYRTGDAMGTVAFATVLSTCPPASLCR